MDEQQEIGITELRASLADILNRVSAQQRTVYVVNRGRRIAALVPLEVADNGQRHGN